MHRLVSPPLSSRSPAGLLGDTRASTLTISSISASGSAAAWVPLLTLISALILSGLTGCGGGTKRVYKSQAEADYWRGMDALADEDFPAADAQFRRVKTKYVFTPFAALAELRLGDSALKQGHHYEAVETYRAFIRSHPQHLEVPYAYWKIGSSYTELRPSRFFLLPPAFERDNNSTKNALVALQNYIKLYPKHKYISKAKAMALECRRELAAHELYVARFYRTQEKWEAARGRYEGLLDQFKDTPRLWIEGAEELVEIYSRLKMKRRAQTLRDLINRGREARESQDSTL